MLTTTQFKTLDDLYMFYNLWLFDGALPDCIVNLSRKPNSYGFFAPNIWASIDETSMKITKKVHELSLNPDYMMRPSIIWHSTLAHEMTHLWQREMGKPSRTGYHNKQWAEKMEAIGLMPSDTGKPGGNRTGQGVTHYIIAGGKFERVFNSLDPAELEKLRLKYLPIVSLSEGVYDPDDVDEPDEDDEGEEGTSTIKVRSKTGVRMKYTCECKNNLWGRSGLQIQCLDCNTPYRENAC